MAFSVVALWIALAMPPVFRARASLLIEPQFALVVSGQAARAASSRTDSLIAEQVEILKSRNLAERAVRTLQLDTHSQFEPAMPLSWISMREALEAAFSGLNRPYVNRRARTRTVVGDFQSGVTIARVPETRLVSIGVEAVDATLAANAANALAEAYIDQLQQSFVDVENKVVFRRIKHFSGYLVNYAIDQAAALAPF